MAHYLLAYKGGGGGVPTEAEQHANRARWGAWLGSLGPAVVNPGAPFAGSKTITPDGTVHEHGATLTGFSILQAESLDAAVRLAKSCPAFAAGGTVEVYEAIPMS